ncbi:MAG: ATP-binding protein [Candidatus Hydrogenedentota bacterium]
MITFKESIPRDKVFLNNVRNNTKYFCSQCNIRKDIIDTIEISVDEIIVNIIEYSNGKLPIEYIFTYKDNVFECKIIDDGAPFDLVKHLENIDISDYIKKRRERGLGLYIVKKFMDTLNIERKENKNIFTLSKKIFAKETVNA